MEQRRGLPQNKTNIHHHVSCSPVLSSLWSTGIGSSTHSLLVEGTMQLLSIFLNKMRKKSTIIQPQTHLASYYIYSRGPPTHPSSPQSSPLWQLGCTNNLHKFRNTLKFPRYSNTDHMDALTHYLTSVEWPPLFNIYSLVEPSQGRITLRSQWDSHGTKERVATKPYKYSPSLIQQSSIAITQAWQERGRELQVRSQWDSHGTRERVATKHNKYSPSCVVFTSHLQLVKHWYSQQHTQFAGMQF